MAKTRDSYRIDSRTLPEAISSLNFILQRISDRLDKIEGIRGDSEIESLLTVIEGIEIYDSDGNLIHSLE